MKTCQSTSLDSQHQGILLRVLSELWKRLVCPEQLSRIHRRRHLRLPHQQTSQPKLCKQKFIKKKYRSCFSISTFASRNQRICQQNPHWGVQSLRNQRFFWEQASGLGLLRLGNNSGTPVIIQERYYETNKISTEDPDVLYDFYALQRKAVSV